MFITREMDYCVRIIRALYRKGMLSAGEIADLENMPQAITYKMLKQLTHAGVINSFRGAEGGYQLAISPTKTTLLDLFNQLDIELFVNRCLRPGYVCENIDCGQCGAHREFERIQTALNNELSAKPLSEFL